MKKIQFSAIEKVLFILSLIMLAIFIWLYPQIFPDSALNFTQTESQINELTVQFLHKYGYHTDDFEFIPLLNQNPTQLRYLQKTFGLKGCNEIIRAGKIPVYFWKVKIQTPNKAGNDLQISYDSDEEAATAVKKMMSDTINVSLATDGRIIGLMARLENKTTEDTLDYQQAIQLATKFLSANKTTDISEYKLISPVQVDAGNGYLYHFEWENKQPVLGQKETVKIEIRGNLITKYLIDLQPPEKIAKKSRMQEIVEIMTVILILGIVLFMVILLIQK